jgi:hypothetical protein
LKKTEKALRHGGQKINGGLCYLIDYFRKTDKANSKLVAHFRNYEQGMIKLQNRLTRK